MRRLLTRLKQVLTAMPRKVRVIVAVVVVGLCFYYLGNSLWRGMQQVDLSQLRVRAGPLLLALGLYTASTLIGGLCWSLILEGLGQRRPLRANVKVHLRANIAKYLPGYAWQILGKAYLCGQQGLPAWTVGLGIGLEFLCVILTGIWVALLTVPDLWLHGWGLSALAVWRWPGASVLAVLLIGFPHVLAYALSHAAGWRQRPTGITIHGAPLRMMLLLMILAWFILGLALYSLVTALYPLPAADLPAVTFSWAASAILSLVVIFVPMGIGVKEGVLTFLLGHSLPAALAAVVAVLARVVSIVSEALCFALAEKL